MTPDVLAAYRPSSRAQDECLAADGQPRPHWLSLLQGIEDLGTEELNLRWHKAQRLLRENGVSFNVHRQARHRPWKLDPYPLLMTASEWSEIETGLRQRALLMECILEDVYGQQNVLREGLLPAELVLGNPGFLRSCHGLPLPSECRLLLYATDLARTPEGRLVVLRHRTENPAGCGYALENRLVMARSLPELLRSCQVRRLAPFFQTLRDTLETMASRSREYPRLALLTPGPYTPTSFEHAYLAQYLGFTLVQGDDLTVRDRKLYLKLLEGLQRVDVVFRWLRDGFCDPLELRSDSVIGVPGLVETVRAGNLVVANSLGSGFLQTPALAEFLPGLCRYFLDQDLLLPGAPSWWCGNPRSLDHVLKNLDRMVLRETFPRSRTRPIFGARLSAEQRAQLKARLETQPYRFVAQEEVSLSLVPTLGPKGLEPRHLVLRTFVTSSPDGYQVMPGGMALVSASSDSLVATLGEEGASKDTWVLAEEDEAPLPLRSTHSPMELSRRGGDVTSRDADNLFWLGRYSQRVEGRVRLLRFLASRLNEEAGAEEVEARALLEVLEPRRLHRSRALSDVLMSLIRHPKGLERDLAAIFRVAGSARGRLSSDAWRVLNTLDKTDLSELPDLNEAQSVLEEMGTLLSAFSGIVWENMTRGHSWRFLDLGRRLERAWVTADLLRSTLSRQHPQEELILSSLLEITDVARTYRRRYSGGLQAPTVVDLLLADESNPRSVGFQLAVVTERLKELPGTTRRGPRTEPEKLVLACLTELRLLDSHRLCLCNDQGRRKSLSKLLRQIRKTVPELSDALSRAYFIHLQATPSAAFGRESR